MAASIVQSGNDTFGASTTATVSLTVSAGNSVIVAVMSYGGGVLPNVSVSDGTSYSSAVRGQNSEVAGGYIEAGIFYRHNHPGGAITVTATNSVSASDSYGHVRVYEVSGLANSAPNQTATNFPAVSGQSTTPTSGTTSATTVANTWVMGVMTANAVGSNGGIDVPATTGYTNLFVDQSSAAELAGAVDVKSVSATGAQSASWGTLSLTAPWVAAIAAFAESAGSTYTLTSNQGTYSISGQAAVQQRTMAATQGTYSLAGQAANLVYTPSVSNPVLTANQGTYNIAGTDVRADLQVTADQGAVSYIGQDANLGKGYKVTANQGAYVLVGQSANLQYSGAGPKVILADQGTYTIAGQDASLRRAARVVSDYGLYNLQGFAVVGGTATDSRSGSSGVFKIRKALIVSTSGRTKWVHYIPVKQAPTTAPGRTDNSGSVEVQLLGSGSGLQEWVDYIPIVEVADSDAGKWRYDNAGWIPILVVE